ncbi:DNA methyltransferase [Paenibacillus sp. GbtcB18]|uniref:DNA methyltransferase n=1 Tax=Paenibacillus sp. GbtcB18 TaxID=2824763 RepID=UPI0020C6D3DC
MLRPPGGTTLDPYAGSGTTLAAAKREGFGFVGIEREPEHVEIIEARTGEERINRETEAGSRENS